MLLLQRMICLISLTSLLTTSNIALAEDSVFLEKDQKAPYSGYLLDKDKVLNLRSTDIDNKYLSLENASLKRELVLKNDILDNKDQQITLYSDRNEKLVKAADSASSLTTWEKLGYFSLGVLAAYASVKLGQAVIKW